MEEITEFNQRHPFQFKIERIKDHVEVLIKMGGFEIAKERIKIIQEKYIKALADKAIPENSWTYRHVNDYRLEENEMKKMGQTYPGGTTSKVIFELNELLEQIRLRQLDNNNQQGKKSKDGKTTEFYALLHFYQRSTIGLTEENKHSFGQKYGFKNGDKLFLDFQRLSDYHNRTKEPSSKTTLKNRIKLLEKVQKELPVDLANGKVKEELKSLRDRFDAMFS